MSQPDLVTADSDPDAGVARSTAGSRGPGAGRRRRPTTPSPLRGIAGKLLGRNGLMFADTAVNALTGVTIVAAAARFLEPTALAAFSLAQVVLTTLTGILRGAVFSPAMAAQRSTGRAVVPLSWSWRVSVPVGVVSSLALVFLVPHLGEDRLLVFAVLALVASVILGTDALRSVLLSREQPQWALMADSFTFATLIALILIGISPHGALAMLGCWAGCVTVGLLLTVVAIVRAPGPDAAPQSLAEAWKLGRWSTLDSVFAATAFLLPLFVSTIAIGNASAGTYRVLQTALGPLNIIQVTVVSIFGLDAWQTASLDGVRALHRKVKILAVGLLALSSACAAAGLPIMAMISGLSDPQIHRIMLVVAAHGIMTACTTPYLAASLALGYQVFGAGIRFVVFVASIIVCLPGSTWVPWHDPIGTSMLLSSSVTLVGWAGSYYVAKRREVRILSGLEERKVRPKRHVGRHREEAGGLFW